MIVPNVKQYKSWNLNEIISWLSSLENSRFNPYLNILQEGFVNDGIDSGEYLPDITKSDLRVEPFKIGSFKDRRDLEKYFKSLSQAQLQPTNTK